MDIAALSMQMAMCNLGTQVGLAVQKIGQDVIEETDGQMIEMMKQIEQSVNPHIGGHIDISL